MNEIITRLQTLPKFEEYTQSLKQNSQIVISGLSDVGKLQFSYATKRNTKKPIFIITYNEIQAKNIIKDLSYFAENDDIVYFPKRDIVPYDYVAESKDILYERMEILNKIHENSADIVVTTIEAIMQKMILPEELYKTKLNFEVGKTYSLQTLKEELIMLGYERNDIVENKGQFSIRGGILDIGTTENIGIRIEFWGDEVDSIREFQISSQRSEKMLQKIKIYAAHEFILQDTTANIIKKIENKDETINSKSFEVSEKARINYFSKMQEIKKADIEIISQGEYISKIDKYFNCFYENANNFMKYIPEDAIIFYDEYSKIKQRIENIIIDNNNLIKSLIEKEKMVPQAIHNISIYEEDFETNNNPSVFLERQDFGLSKNSNIKFNFQYREVNYHKSEIDLLIEDIKRYISEKKQVIVLAGNNDNVEKFNKLLSEKEIVSNKITVKTGRLSAGFECYDLNMVIISGEELFEIDVKKRRKTSNAFKQAEKVVYADLKVGDYVVHKSHGIGQFIGVNTIKADGVTKDYIKIRYQNNDLLYIPTNDLDNVRKYVGGGEATPKVNKLGSKEWQNTKNKVKKNLQEVAKELIELYAKRQKSKGFAFSKDTPWQKQFEDNFPYQETDDQIRCISEVKKDMESQRPMDRLLCGDVGYGKTEVAIRAAFKAVMDQKQVAYLVPTTVLANQQYSDFYERMQEFPIRVEVLNRFKTKKQQQEIIRKLKLGEIDVIIGTHRLLSKDDEFKDLGLLIIDEEQRFGVKDKEKIKQYKSSIDVLTMTATPIPRTLHMSIVGVRDMSVIYEPPQNRKPVQTYVLEYDEEVIKEAITKELERKGQVFYLFNNVEQIEKKEIQVSNLVPEAKVAFAHGKMSGAELEEIMMDFIEGKIDVLVCTTILESGIDIPNANTIIVENADRLGLAQLYQIRGRVGRASKQGYAYVTYKRDKILSEVADKRLKAIKEFTEFGSGFKIAMRDLEIRGAGSMVGEIQHGHMEQVGYDTYCKLLDEVIKEMQGIKVEEEHEVQIDLNVSSYIPEEFIENSSQKIEIYQDIALCKTELDIQNVTDEIIDRYGQIPKEVENLLDIARIKNLCKKRGVNKISQRKDGIIFLYDKGKFDNTIIDTLLHTYGPRVRFSPGTEPYITLKIDFTKTNGDKKLLNEVISYLKIEGGKENADNNK